MTATPPRRRVLVVPSWYPDDKAPWAGGFFEEQALQLAEIFEVAVLAPELVSFRAGVRLAAPWRLRREVRRGLMVFRLAVCRNPWGPLAATYPRLRRAATRARRLICRDWGEPDLIHAHVVLPAGWIAPLLRPDPSIPVVLTEHCGAHTLPFESAVERSLVCEALSAADRVLAVGPGVAERLLDLGCDRPVDVVGNLVRTRFFSPSARPALAGMSHRIRFLSLAAFRPVKGLEDLVRACRLLLDRGVEDFEVNVGGDGPERFAVEGLAASLALGDRFRALGWLTREQTREALQACDVFVTVSHAETFGIAAAEAVACEKPVISTRCGGPDLYLPDQAGLLIPPRDPVALADAMQAFVSRMVTCDPGAARRSIVARFGEEAWLERHARIYGELWSGSRRD